MDNNEVDQRKEEFVCRDEHSILKSLHTDSYEREFCLGAECPDKNCRICAAAGTGRGRIYHDKDGSVVQTEDTWDSYRAQHKGGYYTSSMGKRIVIEVDEDGNEKRVEKYFYHRQE